MIMHYGRWIVTRTVMVLWLAMGPAVAADLIVHESLSGMVRVPVPLVEDFTKALRPGHPRLTLNVDRIQQLRVLIQGDPAAAAWYRGVRNNATWYLAQPDIAYVPEPIPGQRAQVRPMLWPGRDFMDRVYTLGLVVSIDQDPQALARLKQEVLHALDTWKDWSGSIATFEIAAGMGLAYDWLFDHWSEDERARIRVAINDLAFMEYQTLYQTMVKSAIEKQTIPRNNVALVQLCGAAVAALATLAEQPEKSGPVLATSFAVMQGVLRGFGDQGSWFEGVNYWNFGVQHLVQYLASLQTATGSDFGLISTHQFPGVEKTAYFPLFMSGPTGAVFNYADTYEGVFSSPSLLWLGSAYQCVGAWQYEARLGKNLNVDSKVASAPKIGHPRNLALRLIYYRPMSQDALLANAMPPLDVVYSGDEVASLRSSWTDPAAVFVGIKGGSAKGNPHAHLDAGTVILEAFGKRWLSEIPPPRYGRGDWPYAKRYMNEDRYLFFQARTEAHNTLLIDPSSQLGGNQSKWGNAVISGLVSTENEALCQVDLTSVYPSASSAIRKVRLFQQRSCLQILDEVALKTPSTVRWHMYTQAPIVLLSQDGRSVTLKFVGGKDPLHDQRMVMRLNSSDLSQHFVIEPAAPIAESPAVLRDSVESFSRIAVVIDKTASLSLDVEILPIDR